MLDLGRRIIDRIRWERREWRRPSRPAFLHDELDQRPASRDRLVSRRTCPRRRLRPRRLHAGTERPRPALHRHRPRHRRPEKGRRVDEPARRRRRRLCPAICRRCIRRRPMSQDALSTRRPRPRRARELARVLRPGGRLVFSTSNAVSPYSRVQSLALRGDRNPNWSRGNRWSADQMVPRPRRSRSLHKSDLFLQSGVAHRLPRLR